MDFKDSGGGAEPCNMKSQSCNGNMDILGLAGFAGEQTKGITGPNTGSIEETYCMDTGIKWKGQNMSETISIISRLEENNQKIREENETLLETLTDYEIRTKIRRGSWKNKKCTKLQL